MLVASNAFILHIRHSKISLLEFNDVDEVEEEECAKVTSVMAKSYHCEDRYKEMSIGV